MRKRLAVLVCLLAVAAGCRDADAPSRGAPVLLASAAPAASSGAPPADDALESCLRRIGAVREKAALPGAPSFDARRAEILGRARGEPMVFVSEPQRSLPESLSEEVRRIHARLSRRTAFDRIRLTKQQFRGDRATLRGLLLAEGYVYSSDPIEALALVGRLELTDLFEEERIWLQRGSATYELKREVGRPPRYVHDDGGSAELLFGDRVAVAREGLVEPLHRDLRRLAQDVGFERAKLEHITPAAIVARLRFSGEWALALLSSKGAALSVSCLAEPRERRRRFEAHIVRDEPRRAALRRLRATVALQVRESLPFDRPRGEETADRDGQLRPAWRFAYQRGQSMFRFEEDTYPVFDGEGRPRPPQVCVDFVLDSYERAAGTWYQTAVSERQRVVGQLDFDAYGITNRRGVLAFEKFAMEKPELFEHERFGAAERIQFRERERFFAFLTEHADRFRPGDVLAIQGRKNDGLIHQHAILVEDTDPITGMPDALADQMKRPRRRTWEGIMAEAPLRSLLYRVRPKPSVLHRASGRSDG